MRPHEESQGSGSESTSGRDSSSKELSTTSKGSTERRQWSCWCAAHRPKPAATPHSTDDEADKPTAPPPIGLIILELELEHDLYNPLYPPPDPVRDPSPVTPSEGSGGTGSGGGRTDSDKTAMPTANSTTPTGTDDNSLTPTGADTNQPIASIAPSTTPTSADASSPTPPTIENTSLHMGGSGEPLEDPSTWGPTPEQIIASTTSRSQPIRALERMRQAERTAQQRRIAHLKRGAGVHPGGTSSRHRGGYHGGRLGTSAGSGSLDVFAVLGQVNEQLSGAPDLQTFLDVVTGIMKDLTQFHRVLIYQFDEIANGQVSLILESCFYLFSLYE